MLVMELDLSIDPKVHALFVDEQIEPQEDINIKRIKDNMMFIYFL